MVINWILFIVFVVMQVLDVYTTKKALDTGKASEANPVAAFFFKRFGVMPTMIAMKIGIIALLAWFNFAAPDHLYSLGLDIFGVGLGSYVMFNNFKALKDLHG